MDAYRYHRAAKWAAQGESNPEILPTEGGDEQTTRPASLFASAEFRYLY